MSLSIQAESSTTKNASENLCHMRPAQRTDKAFRYHWALLVGPKKETTEGVPGFRYHVRNTPAAGWKYEEEELKNVQNTINLLARIVIAKVEDHSRLVAILRRLPVIQNDPSWRCRSWIGSALEELARDGKAVGTSHLDWAKVEATARQYVADKVAAGRYLRGEDMLPPKPTWDMMESKETVA